MFTLYHADFIGSPGNCSYPHEVHVTDATSLQSAVRYDYVCAEYRNNYRNSENFIGSTASRLIAIMIIQKTLEEWVSPKM